MAAAYQAVESGHFDKSSELNTLAHIDRYGYGAIYDRPLRLREIRGFNLAETVKVAYLSRNSSKMTWAEWAQNNPEQNRILNRAIILANKEDG